MLKLAKELVLIEVEHEFRDYNMFKEFGCYANNIPNATVLLTSIEVHMLQCCESWYWWDTKVTIPNWREMAAP
ncbi:hypothetical protein DPMN_128607 [Dreissena polymorpha]|uniref:Uncharacterized protein n=1 Tax=Dreissena polymorpha TaxID=45954 RepID=A0A9D4H7H5_DREPO|nr:hypothetical protein DPMN_128607 [Dreissena polymorpha]